MVRNILKNVKPGRLRRLDVAFKIEETNIDSLIGRTAHILFLENAELIKTIIYTHQSMFS